MPLPILLPIVLLFAPTSAAPPVPSPRPCGRTLTPVAVDTTFDVRDTWPKDVLKAIRFVPPRHPVTSGSGRRQGEARASFVVDTLGQVVPGSGRIESETAREFGDAVCAVLYQMRFEPVVIDGHKRTVLVTNQLSGFHTQR